MQVKQGSGSPDTKAMLGQFDQLSIADAATDALNTTFGDTLGALSRKVETKVTSCINGVEGDVFKRALERGLVPIALKGPSGGVQIYSDSTREGTENTIIEVVLNDGGLKLTQTSWPEGEIETRDIDPTGVATNMVFTCDWEGDGGANFEQKFKKLNDGIRHALSTIGEELETVLTQKKRSNQEVVDKITAARNVLERIETERNPS